MVQCGRKSNALLRSPMLARAPGSACQHGRSKQRVRFSAALNHIVLSGAQTPTPSAEAGRCAGTAIPIFFFRLRRFEAALKGMREAALFTNQRSRKKNI